MICSGKKARQYLGLFAAILAYYMVHEGAHLICALWLGVFKEIRFIGIGVQIDVFSGEMSASQMGIFCIVGSLAALAAAYGLVLCTDRITAVSSKVFKACMYYITAALLLVDPLYLSVLCGFFGGGDMNGISLLLPEGIARALYGILFLAHAVLFAKVVLPKYKRAFPDSGTDPK